MDKFNRYEFEGICIDIPLRYDELSQMYLEEYPDFIKDPVYTKKGMPLTLCVEDACENAKPIAKNKVIDCSDCRYFVRADKKTLFGYCSCSKNKKIRKIKL